LTLVTGFQASAQCRKTAGASPKITQAALSDFAKQLKPLAVVGYDGNPLVDRECVVEVSSIAQDGTFSVTLSEKDLHSEKVLVSAQATVHPSANLNVSCDAYFAEREFDSTDVMQLWDARFSFQRSMYDKFISISAPQEPSVLQIGVRVAGLTNEPLHELKCVPR
jgi:hypothetical protein